MHLEPNLAIVLVEPQNPGNIGMVCRAMKNMGLSSLRLVNPCRVDHPEAVKFAVSAKHLLGEAKVFPTLAEALADIPLSVATTRRHGKYRQEIFTPDEISIKIRQDDGINRAAVVFGREDSGLTTDEVSLCRWQATIPTGDEFGSLNLAQAVLIFCYEFFKSGGGTVPRQGRILAAGNELDIFFDQMEKSLLRIGFLNPQNPAHMMRTMRRIFNRAELDEREVSALRGMLSQIDWAAAAFEGKK
jgi:tRNA/rRNA methyltransferase